MPSFDVVSEVDLHEVSNAVDQASREVATRFDFKGTNSKFELDTAVVNLSSESEFQLKQMLDILNSKLSRRKVDVGCLEVADVEISGHEARQKVTVRQGIEKDLARKLVKKIKSSGFKVQAAIQGEQVRVTGKKRDDLQAVIASLGKEDFGLPLQFINFRN